MAKGKHTPTNAMRAAAKRGIDMIQNGSIPEDSVHELSLKSGRKIAAGQKISDDHVRSMAQYHSAHTMPFAGGSGGCPVGGEDGDDSEHCDDLLWGGPAGAGWSASRVAAMDATALAEAGGPELDDTLLASDDLSIEVFARGHLLDERLDLKKDEEGLIWAPIIRSGTIAMRPNPNAPGGKEKVPLVFVSGHSADPGKEIGLADLMDAFDEKAVEHVTIPKTHGNNTFENTGEIVKMKMADSTTRPGEKVILAGHRFTEPDVEGLVERGSVLSRSCGILHRYTNQETAKTYPHVIEHVALTNRPWVTGMEPYGSDCFSEDRQIVPMLLSEDITVPPPKETTLRKDIFSTADPIESLTSELNLADIQWGDEPSLEGIKTQLWSQLREMGRSPDYDESSIYFSVMDVSVSDQNHGKALVRMDYGDPDGADDAWVIPWSLDAQHTLHFADFGEWSVVEQKWVTDEDADQDKQEVQELLYKDALSMEMDINLSEQTLNLAVLTSKARKSLPKSAFVFPGDDPPSYPIHDLAHAKNALSRGSQYEKGDRLAKIRAAVYRKYPQLKNSQGDHTPTNSSLPEDPLARASVLRLSQEPSPPQQGGTHMGLTKDLLDRLNLDDTSRELLQRQLQEDERDHRELEELRASRRQDGIKTRIDKLSEMGFKDCPGFLRTVEQILLSDDGQVAVNLMLSADGAQREHQTITQVVDRIIAAMPTGEQGKVDLSQKANLLTSPLDQRPDLKPEEVNKELSGDQLLEMMEKHLGPNMDLELAPVGGKKKE